MPHKSSWKNLGKVFQVSSEDLARISQQYSSQPSKALTQVNLQWVLDRNTADVSYNVLANALRYIGHPSSADEVARRDRNCKCLNSHSTNPIVRPH